MATLRRLLDDGVDIFSTLTTLAGRVSLGTVGLLCLLASQASAATTGGRPAAIQLVENALVVSGAVAGLDKFNEPRGIAVDALHGEVLLANTGDHRIDVFDYKGHLRNHLVHMVPGPDAAFIEGQPRSLAVDQAGHTLVVDNLASFVDVLDFRGRSVGRLDLGRAAAPGAIAVGPQGSILVASRGDSGRVFVFTRDYKLSSSWGVAGKSPGQFLAITGLAVTPEGNVVVTCAQTELAVQVFSPDGKYVMGYGKHDIGAGNFSLPSGVAVTADGRVWVSDEIRHEVQVFDNAGSYMGTVGGFGSAPGAFQYPSALASDGKSYLVVAERVGARFQLLAIR